MPQLLLELFSEEIPARMQAAAARDLERMAREHLSAAGLLPEAMKTFAGPRRLTLVVEGLPAAQGDRREEAKGPRVGSPDAAIEGFLRKTGLTRDQLVERDGLWFAVIEKKGRPTPQIVGEMVEAMVRGFPWPKSMKWGTGSLRWVRPLQSILCVFAGEVVPFEIDGIASGDLTEGHRFMGGRQPLRATSFEAYAKALADNFVELDVEDRTARILHDARNLCFARNLEFVEDEGLLNEVAGLVEWPVPILGDMEQAFLELPPEVIRTSMRTHQKYFTVRDIKTGKLAPNFLAVANIKAVDGGSAIAAGNARVLSARLKDAQFFWDEDRKVRLEDRLEKLKGVTFHARLGTMHQRVERIEALARELAPLIGADPELAGKAARLAKADLGTGMVGEFPELQGLMGRYYAIAEGLEPEVADAIGGHYRPQGPNDAVPTAPLAVVVALADKLDLIASFFVIHEQPTGSRDPYALRRAALGVIRLCLESSVRIHLLRCLARQVLRAGAHHLHQLLHEELEFNVAELAVLDGEVLKAQSTLEKVQRATDQIKDRLSRDDLEPADVTAAVAAWQFFADRLKVLLREQGKRHDLVDAVFALGDDDLVRIVARVEALDGLLTTDDGANLLAGYKRATNILKAEEKKGPLPTGPAAAMPGAPAEERALIAALSAVEPQLAAALDAEDFAAAMKALATLRGPVDAFFDKVLVNSDVAAERDNRLRLLAQVRRAMGRVADFSLVSG